MKNKGVIIAIVIFFLLCISTIALVMVGAGAQGSLNSAAQAETISGTTPAFAKYFCPTNPKWTKMEFTNGTYCIQPGSTATTDNKGNLTGAVVGPCTGTMQTINGKEYCVTS